MADIVICILKTIDVIINVINCFSKLKQKNKTDYILIMA
jgi:hypothetical protein